MISETIQTTDGLRLYVRHWQIENPKAAILLFHGLGEHIGRYEHVAAALNKAGYAVVGLDHRTHGKSEGEPRTQVLNIDTFVDDAEILWKQIQETYAGKPLFVIGHSMGGQIAVRFTLRHQSEMRGLVTSGAALSAADTVPGFTIPISKAIARLSPNAAVIPAIASIYLSHAPDLPKKYDTDPLVYHGKIRLGLAAAMITGELDALARAHTLTLPMLILHGGADRVVLPIASQKLYERIRSADKTLKIYDGLYHEIFNEIEQDQIIGDVIHWLDAH